MSIPCLAFAAAMLLAPASSTPAAAEEAAKTAPSGLELQISSPNTTVQVGQPLALRVHLVNRGPQTIVLRGNPGFTDIGGFELRVAQAGGAERALPVRITDIDRDALLRGDRRRLLRPGHSFAISYLVPIEQVFTQPGQVQLRARYQSPLPLPGNPSVRADELEGANAESAPLDIEVQQ